MYNYQFYTDIGLAIKNQLSAKGWEERLGTAPINFPYLPQEADARMLGLNFSNPANESYFDYRKLNLSPKVCAVIFQAGRITCATLTSNQIGVSFSFSGCVMAKFSYNNQLYICHIQRGVNDRWAAWNDFVEQNGINVLAIFRPTNLHDVIWREHERFSQSNICGVITPTNKFYSVLYNTFTCKPIYIEEWFWG